MKQKYVQEFKIKVEKVVYDLRQKKIEIESQLCGVNARIDSLRNLIEMMNKGDRDDQR